MMPSAKYLVPLVLGFSIPTAGAATITASSEACAGFTGYADHPVPYCQSGDSTGAGSTIPPGTGVGSGIAWSLGPASSVSYDGQASVLQDFGIFKGSASVKASSTNPNVFGGSYGASATGTFSDTWTLQGGTGMGYLQFAWTVTGSTAMSASTTPGYVADAGMYITVRTSGQIETGSPAAVQGFNGTGTLYGPGTYQFYDTKALPFYFNLPVDITVSSTVFAGVGYNRNDPPATFGGQASADFSHTAILSGVIVYDVFGNVIDNVSLTAASGTVYPLSLDVPTPVPEPESYVMLLAGLGMLGFAARRQRK